MVASEETHVKHIVQPKHMHVTTEQMQISYVTVKCSSLLTL